MRTRSTAMPRARFRASSAPINRRIITAIMATIAFAGSMSALAEGAKRPWEEYEKRVEKSQSIAALGSDLFGDQVSLQNGGLSFEVVDVSIPGNHKLPVEFRRAYVVENRRDYFHTEGMLADWNVAVPSISGSFAADWLSSGTPGNRCSDRLPPPAPGDYLYSSFWGGLTMNIPGVTSGELLATNAGVTTPTDGPSYKWVTNDQVHVYCLPSIANAVGGTASVGEGFMAVGPDGTKYRFDHMAQYFEPHMEKMHYDAGDAFVQSTKRRKNVLYATRAEDRFGNWVTYTYSNSWNTPGRLTKIQSSDGRSLTISYGTNGRVSSVTTDGSRTWTYGYGVTTKGQTTLTQVTRPDASRWQLALGQFTDAEIETNEVMSPMELYRSCKMLEMPPNYDAQPVATITHPSGATGTFKLEIVEHGRTNVPLSCGNVSTGDPYWGNNPNDDVNTFVLSFNSLTLTEKSISGPGVTTATWTYDYPLSRSFFYPGNSTPSWPACTSGSECFEPNPVCAPACPGSSKTIVRGPNNEWTQYTFGNSFRYNEGKLLQIEKGRQVGTGEPTVLETVVNSYDLSLANNAYPASYGASLQPNLQGFANAFHRPLLQRDISRQGETFTWRMDDGCTTGRCANTFAAPTKVTKSSTLGFSKTEINLYQHDLAKWVINLPKSLQCSISVPTSTACDGDFVSSTTYGANLLPSSVSTFGKHQYSLTYNPDGSLATFKDGRNFVTSLANWYRGVPRSITYPDTTSETATVNPDGTLASVTDENGFTTSYGYDDMGRLDLIKYPTGDSTNWNQTSLTFEQVGIPEHGIAANHWRQTIQTGNGIRTSYFDALWRPVVVREYDATNESATQRFTRFAYDHEGRKLFASYPSTVSNPSTGVYTTYDVLGRPTVVRQTSELGDIYISTAYLAGFYTRVTNPNHNQTRTWFQAYDEPSMEWPSRITHPLGLATEITRDPHGKPTTLLRRDAQGVEQARTYSYFSVGQQLCRHVEPETGATVMGYDAAGNLAWSAAGLPASTSCNTAGTTTAILARKVARTYDPRNRLETLAFPDGRGDQVWNYTPDGLPEEVITSNSFASPMVTNAYSYNKRRLLTGEAVEQSGLYTWSLGYGYNANGHLSSHVYPTGRTVGYAPNALGQATQVGTYASGASYFPNGGVKQFTYGNGIVHELTQNARGMPLRSRDAYGSSAVLDDSYDYDPNGNVLGISDGATGTGQRGNRNMHYDALDRLLTTSSPMFNGTVATYDYDGFDNLIRVIAPGRDHHYCYDGSNRLTNIKTGISCSNGSTEIGIGYDVQGNLENKNGLLFDFDFGNRLKESGTAALALETYGYDAHGRRVQSSHTDSDTIYSMYGQDGVIRYQENYRTRKRTSYLYLAGSLVAELDDTATVSASPTLSTSGDSTGGEYAISWTAVSGVDHYRLEESADNGAWQQVVKTATRTWNASGKSNGNYRYRVRACKLGCSNYSTVMAVTVAKLEDDPPVLSAPPSAVDGNYTVSWTAVTVATSYLLQESVNGGAWVTAFDGATLAKSFAGRPTGDYAYRVRACNLAGCTAYSATATVATIHPPTAAPALTVPANGHNGSYTISWGSVATATSYTLQQSANGGSWTTAYTGANLSKAYSGVAAGTYAYRVQACNVAGCSVFSATGSVTVVHKPASAPALTVPGDGHNGSYTIGWGSVATATSYTLQQSANGGSWTTAYTGANLSKAYSGVAAGTYAYRVQACNVAGCSVFSATGSVTVVHKPASAPALTVPVNGHNGSYTISWGSVATATSYTLQQSANGGSWTAAYSGANLSKAYSGVAAGTYAYRVQACNVAGCSVFSATGSVTVVHKPASAPALTVPVNGHNGSYTISWGSVATATSYTLQQSANGGAWATVYIGAGLSKAYSGVSAGSYSYRVQACNVAGCSVFSASGSVTVVHQPASAPTVTTPAANNTGAFTVTWTAVATTTRYELWQRINGGTWSRIHNAAGTSKALSGLGNGSYEYRASACNEAGCSAYSAIKTTVVTHPPSGTSSLSAPGSVNSGSAFTVSWTAVSTATRYELHESRNSGAWTIAYDGGGTSTSLTRSMNGYYEYRVRGCNVGGCGPYSNIRVVTVENLGGCNPNTQICTDPQSQPTEDI